MSLRLILLILTVAAGCGQERDSKMFKIIGKNNLMPVPDNFKYIPAIGEMGNKCTVSHLGDGYVLTSGHCLGGPTRGLVFDKSCTSPKFEIVWGRTDFNPKGILKSKCKRIIARQYNRRQDYGLLKIRAPYPKREFTYKSTYNARGLVEVISHPNGKPMRTSGRCPAYTSPESNRILYSCDTQQGSSGAPILDKNYQIIGVHNFELFDRNGGTLLHNTYIEKILP